MSNAPIHTPNQSRTQNLKSKILPILSLLLLPAATHALPVDSTAFLLSRGKIIVPVHLNGVGPYSFLLDAAAPQPVIDRNVATYLGLPAGFATTVSLSQLRIGAYSPTETIASLDDLSPLGPRAGVAVQGILPGRLGLGQVTIDFARGTLSYGSPIAGRFPYSAAFDLTEAGLQIDVMLDGKHQVPARLDTTYGGVMALPASLADKLKLVTPSTPRLQFELPEDSPFPLESAIQVRLKSVAIGGAELLDPPCALLDKGDRPIVGTGFLQHFQVMLDYEANRLGLADNGRKTPRCEPIVGFGLILGACTDGYWTVYTSVNGPAYRAGIKSGDRIAAIGGVSQKDVPYADIAARLAAPDGTTATIVFLHGDKTREITLTAEQLF